RSAPSRPAAPTSARSSRARCAGTRGSTRSTWTFSETRTARPVRPWRSSRGWRGSCGSSARTPRGSGARPGRLTGAELLPDPAGVPAPAPVPGGQVVDRDPAPLLLAVVPVLLDLVEDLQPAALQDVRDLVVVVVRLVVVRDRALAHLRVQQVQVLQQAVQLGLDRLHLQPEAARLPARDRVLVRRGGGVQPAADALGLG